MGNVRELLLRGFRGHPLHPPLTDATIGALIAGSIAVLLAWIGVRPETMATAGFVVLVMGIVLALPTALTGLADYVVLPRGPARRTAVVHLTVMIVAVVLFGVALGLLYPGYPDGEVPFAAGVMTLVAMAVLTLGGWLGGTLVYVHGVRVLARPEEPTSEAVRPRMPEDGETQQAPGRGEPHESPGRRTE